jgi:hypothetical protein
MINARTDAQITNNDDDTMTHTIGASHKWYSDLTELSNKIFTTSFYKITTVTLRQIFPILNHIVPEVVVSRRQAVCEVHVA